MAEDSPELKMVKSMLRSVLLSCKEGIQANGLLRDYQDVVGERLPFKRLGYDTLEDFILSIPDVVRVERKGPDFIFHAVADDSTAHIKALVSKQRGKRKLKKPVRRPRGGGVSSFAPRPSRGPPSFMSNPRPSGPRSKPGVPSFIAQQYRKPVPISMMTVEIDNTKQTGNRIIHVDRTQLLARAMTDVTNQRHNQPTDRNSSSARYELPPRFRKKMGEQTSPPFGGEVVPKVSRPHRPKKPTSFGQISDGKKYLDQLNQHMRDTGESSRFQTTQVFQGFASSITLNNMVFGSEDFFKTAAEAEQAAARNALLNLHTNTSRQPERVLPEIDWNSSANENSNSLSSLPANQIAVIRSRVQEILKNKKNGLWSTRIPFEYKEKFNEEPPDNLIEMLKNWPDIAKLDLTPTLDRYIVFPVEEEFNDNMNLVIPRDLLVKRDEKVIVYMSFIFHPGYFFIQREDSPIDNITDLLQTHCKTTKPINPKHLKKGMFCAGLYSGDGNWTRAEVLHPKDNDTAELLFVDYGNIENVKVSDMRWLSAELVKMPIQAITCTLYNMEFLEEETEWSSKSSLLFARHVEDKELIATPREFYDGLVDVELHLKSDPQVNIATLLCDAGVIRDVSKEGRSTEEEVLEPDELVLPADKEWDVHITYISSSTNSVMLRLVGEEHSDKLDAFQSQLEKTFKATNSASGIVEGGIYVAFDDELYHRVRAMVVENNKVLCYFLDHGDTDYLLSNQLKPLDPKVNRLLPYQAIEIRLNGLEEVSTNVTALEKLCDMTLGKTCVAVILERGEIPSLVLYDTSTDVEININQTILKTIEREGGGIDSPRVASPVPERVISPVPGRVISPVLERAISPVSGRIPSPVPDRVISPVLGLSSSTPNSVISPSISASNITTNQATNIATNQAKHDTNSETIKSNIPVDSETRRDISSVSLDSSRATTTIPVSPTYPMTSNSIPDVSVTSNSVAESVLNDLKSLAIHGGGDNQSSAQSGSTNQIVPKPYQLPPQGSYVDVYVPFVIDPYNFVCIPYDEMDTLNSLLVDMLKYYSPLPTPMDPTEIQQGCVYAGYKDDMWVRVKILDFVGTDLVSVYSVDIGEYSVMMLTEVQPLPKQFAELPMMAIISRLGTIKPKSGTWYEAAKYKFIDLARGKDLVALVQGRDEDTQTVSLRLIDTSDDNVDVCIDEVLVKKGFADLI